MNGYNVEQGQNATYYTDVKIEINEETLVISFSEEYAEDNQNEEIENRLLYKIEKPENIEYISVLKNGQEVPIDSIIVVD